MRKTRIVPTIVISNFPLARCYPLVANGCEDESINALRDRFIEVELAQQGNPFDVSGADERLANEMMEAFRKRTEEIPRLSVRKIVKTAVQEGSQRTVIIMWGKAHQHTQG